MAKDDYVPLTAESARALLDEALEQDDNGAATYLDDDSVEIRSTVERIMEDEEAAGRLASSLDDLDLTGRGTSGRLEPSGPAQRAERDGWLCVGGVNGLGSTGHPLSLEDEVHSLFRNLKGAIPRRHVLVSRRT